MLTPWEKGYDRPRQHIKKQRHCFINKGLYSQSYGFSTHCVWMWELDHKAGWAQKKWCFGTVVLEKTLESPLGCKEFKLANPKGNQPWVFTGRTGAEASIFPLPPDAKSRLIENTLILRKIEGRRRGQQRMRWLDSVPDSINMNLSKLLEIVTDGEPGVLLSMRFQRVRHNLVTEQQQIHCIILLYWYIPWAVIIVYIIPYII